MIFQRRAVVVCACVALWASVSVRAQWPTVLMFYGAPLKAPIFVTGGDSVAIAQAFKPATASTAPRENASAMGSSRPFISVACFWGPPSNPAMNGVAKLSDLKPEMANQHARFYPATASQPAAIFTTTMLLVKGRDTQGALTTKSLRGSPPPTQVEQFISTGSIPPAVIDTLRKLGIPVGG